MPCYIRLQTGGRLLLQTGNGDALLLEVCPAETAATGGAKPKKKRISPIQWGENFPLADDPPRRRKMMRGNHVAMVLLH